MACHVPSTARRNIDPLMYQNLSLDPEQEYFADGMTDDLITDLAKISALRVVSRTSIMQYQGTKKSELNVDAVLEGTVARDHDRVRITAQLIGADPEKHLWAEKYETSLSDVLTEQDDESGRACDSNQSDTAGAVAVGNTACSESRSALPH
jgi:TolB-like protein